MGDVVRIQTLRDFEALKGEWQALHEAAQGGIFAHHGFLSAWSGSFGKRHPLDVVTLMREGRLLAALPLFRTGKDRCWAVMGEGRAGMAQWLLHPELTDPVQALAQLIQPDRLSFIRLEPVEAADAELMEQAARHAGLTVLRKSTMAADSLRLSGDFEQYLQRAKASTRQKFHRSERKLAALPDRNDLRSDRDGWAAMEAFIATSRLSWKNRTGTGLGASATGEQFLKLLWDRLGPETCFFAARMTGTEPISARFMLLHDGTHYGMANDFNEKFAKLGAGRNSVMVRIRDAFEDGARHFDFTRSTPLTHEVSNRSRPLERLLIARPGDPALGVYLAGRAARRLKRKATGWKKGRAGVMS